MSFKLSQKLIIVLSSVYTPEKAKLKNLIKQNILILKKAISSNLKLLKKKTVEKAGV